VITEPPLSSDRKTLVDLPTEMLLAIIARVDFSPNNLINVSLVNKHIKAVMIGHKAKVLNDIEIVQFPEGKWMRALLKEEATTVSTLVRSRKSDTSINAIAELLAMELKNDPTFFADSGESMLRNGPYLFEGLHYLFGARDGQIYPSAVIVHLDSDILKGIHCISLVMMRILQKIRRAHPISVWDDISFDENVELAIQDLVLKYGVSSFLDLLSVFLPDEGAKHPTGKGQTSATGPTASSNRALALTEKIQSFRASLNANRGRNGHSIVWWLVYNVQKEWGVPFNRFLNDESIASWGALMQAYLLWKLVDLPEPDPALYSSDDFFPTTLARCFTFCLNTVDATHEQFPNLALDGLLQSPTRSMALLSAMPWQACVRAKVLGGAAFSAQDIMGRALGQIDTAVAMADGLRQQWRDEGMHKTNKFGMLISLEKLRTGQASSRD
jgi:hypothetical protein